MAKKTGNSRDEAKDEPTFEEAMERLESLVARMEADQLPLEELVVQYEEGIKLVKFCSEKLTAAEKRIEIITRDAQGQARAETFEPETGKAADSGGTDARLF